VALVLGVATVLLQLILPMAAHTQEEPVDAQSILDAMTVADRVGQLFLVAFEGDDLSPESEIAQLIRDYRIGGVLLQAEARNFRNVELGGAPSNTPEQVAQLTNQLQALAFDGVLPAEQALAPTLEAVEALPVPEGRGITLPLLVAAEQEGDGYPYSSLRSGFTPLPSNMALGATWSAEDAATAGRIAGEELAAVGVNLLVGPSLDVLDAPRADPEADLGIRSLGGNPYWVGRLGRAYVGGVHDGSLGRVATVSKHFPGQGNSDRDPQQEIATIQKTAAELAAVELAPFAAAVKPGTLAMVLPPASAAGPGPSGEASTTTDGLMSTHIRYAGLQGGGEAVPPISLAPQLGEELLRSADFAGWRRDPGGVVLSESLGAPGIRQYYDPTLQSFPYKRIAQEALVAGNDLLLLSRFALTDDWADQLANIKETITFFQEKYGSDADFRRRVDEAVLRILRLKARMYPDLSLAGSLVDGGNLADRIGQAAPTVAQLARNAVTLISPSAGELAQRLPTGPGPQDRILIFSDARTGRDCDALDCASFPLVPATAMEEIILRLYGPNASGQMSPDRVRSLTFEQLSDYLEGVPTEPPAEEIDRLINEASWLVFAMQDVDANVPSSSALRRFLSERPELRERKRLVAMALGAPYYLDATDISKLTAYFGVFGKTPPFLEAAVRALFREFTPTGASPVDIAGTNYRLDEKLRPNPNQTIPLQLPDVRVQMGSNTFTAKVDDTLRVLAGPILDFNGRLVPDGTVVSFKLKQRGDQFQLPLEETGTVDGYADASVVLERAGDFEVQVQSGQASGSLSLILSIVDEEEGQAQVAVATATPTPVPTPTVTPTATPTPEPTATPTPRPTPLPPPEPPLPPRRVDLGAFVMALLAISLVSLGIFLAFGAMAQVPESALRLLLFAVIGGLLAYSLYGMGLLPGATWMQRELQVWGAALVAAAGSLTPILVIWVREELRR
jgi:beta-N-acetylhexosaminidase